MSNVQADQMVALLHDNGRDPDVATDDGHDNLYMSFVMLG